MIASVGPRQMPYPGLRPFEAEDAPLFFGARLRSTPCCGNWRTTGSSPS